MTQAQSILVVEDEGDIRDLIILHLKRDGYAVDSAADGEEGMKKLSSMKYDLIVLDWMLPGMSGLEIVKTLRATGMNLPTPVLMVTARVEATDIVRGLEAGADDYVTKPFELPVLLARVRALLRRISKPAAPEGDSGLIQCGNLVVNPESYDVRCNGESIQLTLSEYKLLLTLVQNRGRVLTRDQLIDNVQGQGVTVVDRAIDTHIFGLRKKLGSCADLVETVRGVGYRVKTEI
ncbi:response regulator transcription factor [bacterium]|nr:response regulator transcription factor [bacterium]